MAKKKVLITGATGFVGNRLAERMFLSGEYDVFALIHRFSGPGLARLARLPVQFIAVDILDLNALEAEIEDLDIIVHMAYGTSGNDDEKREVTVSGTENIMKLGLKKNVEKIVHLSTAAVYGTAPGSQVVTESAEFQRSQDVYRESKIQAEEIVWRYREEHNLPVVVFRPPLIYGPYGGYWTARIVKEIQDGAILVNGGSGQANLIYVDNLIDAIFLAIKNASADGQGFILVDDDEFSWREVYEAYSEKLSSPPPMLHKTIEEIEIMRKGDYPNDLKSWVVKPFFLIPEILRTSFQSSDMRQSVLEVPWLRYVKEKISRVTIDEMIKNANNYSVINKPTAPIKKIKPPQKDLVDLYASTSRFSNAKAKDTLGYQQRISFHQALDLIFDWLRYQWLVK